MSTTEINHETKAIANELYELAEHKKTSQEEELLRLKLQNLIELNPELGNDIKSALVKMYSQKMIGICRQYKHPG